MLRKAARMQARITRHIELPRGSVRSFADLERAALDQLIGLVFLGRQERLELGVLFLKAYAD